MIARLLSAAALMMLAAGTAAAESHSAGGSDFEITGDAAEGEKVFRKCMACHAVGPEAKNKVGPELNGILGRPAATAEGYAYSNPMKEKAAGGLVWTPETIAGFIAKPRDYIKGTKMSFAGLRKEEDQLNVIAYLATFNAEGGGS